MKSLFHLKDAYQLTFSEDKDVAQLGLSTLKQAAQEDNCSAMLKLISIYDKTGIAANNEIVEYWLKKFRELIPKLSEPEDLYEVGSLAMWDLRFGLSQIESLTMLKKAGDAGHPQALFLMYEETRYKNPLNFDRMKSLELSASAFNIHAMVELSSIIYKENPKYATILLKTATELGSSRAKEMLTY